MRIILHIDMNSYFASVEQQARPFLIGKPIAVVGSTKARTIIVAASVEAKKFGVKTGTQLWEAKKLCPQIILVGADCKKYESISRQFLKIFISKTPQVEIFSIDEAFLQMPESRIQKPDTRSQIPDTKSQTAEGRGWKSDFKKAQEIAKEIKQEIKEKIGQNIRCSVGIAQNKFMAKLASEAHKPDGLTIVEPGREIEFLDQFELQDACGIGRRIGAHLAELGINSFKDLRQQDLTKLTLIFNSYGLRLYQMSRGLDFDPIHPYHERPHAKSISRSKTLMKDTFDRELIKKMILAFCEHLSKELRETKVLASNCGLYLRFGDFTGFHKTQKIKSPTNTTQDIYKNILMILDSASFKKGVRKIGIYAGGLTPDQNQLVLSWDFAKNLALDKISDRVNNKIGKPSITRGALINLNFTGETPNFGFKKNMEI